MIDEETQDLYQEVILDHYRNPRNHCEMDCPTHSAKGNNPLCGDKLELYVKLDGDKIEDLTFKGAGCAISQASASLMTEQLKGHTVKDAMETFDKVHCMLTGKHPDELSDNELDEMGKLQALSGICEYPMRVKCASLAWHTLKSAIEQGKKEPNVSTE
jgi:nitrogen fixation NifU-like protein